MSRVWLSVSFSLAFAVTGCARPAAESPPSEPSETSDGVPPAPVPPEAREPVVALPAAPQPVEVELRTSDGVVLHGTLQAARRPEAPAAILVHQLGSDRREWQSLVDALGPDVTTLAFDVRGHGESTEGPSGALAYASFDTDAWAAAANDVAAALAFLRSDASHVRPARITVVGASIGATSVVLAAAADTSIDSIVLLSPGRAYHGVDAITPAMQLGHRALLTVAANEEVDASETSHALARLTTGESIDVPGQAHGVALLADEALRNRVVAAIRGESAR